MSRWIWLVPVMTFMQGPGLLLIAPLILAWFVGSIWLSVALAKAGAVPRWHPWIYLLAPLVIVVGIALVRSGAIAPRFVGLSMLAVFSAAQIHAGAALRR